MSQISVNQKVVGSIGANQTIMNNSNYYDDDKLLAPYNYILKLKGKNLRSKFSKAFNNWLKISDEQLKIVNEIVEMLHNCSLLIDDIQDHSVLRRGSPVANHKFGMPLTLNCANYVQHLALSKLIGHFPPEIVLVGVKSFTRIILEAHIGQGMEMHWRDSFICPTEQMYFRMVKQKTGGIFLLIVQLMQLFSWDKRDYSQLCENIGILYQIRDDYINLVSDQYKETKGFCEDLTEGKFSFPLIHAIQKNLQEDDTTLINILKKKADNVELKKYAIKHMKHSGSFQYTLEKIQEYHDKIVKEIELLGGNQDLTDILEALNFSQ